MSHPKPNATLTHLKLIFGSDFVQIGLLILLAVAVGWLAHREEKRAKVCSYDIDKHIAVCKEK